MAEKSRLDIDISTHGKIHHTNKQHRQTMPNTQQRAYRGWAKKWHTLGIWVCSLATCIIFAIFRAAEIND